MKRRTFLHCAAGTAALPVLSRLALAQDYPTRPVHLFVGVAPGGGNDIVARLLAQWLSDHLGQPFVVDNRPGAGTNLATEAVVNARPDGYTLLLVSTSAAINATLYDNLNFNFIRDIVPVGAIVSVPNIMYVHPSVPAKTLPEFISYAKANPGKLTVASGVVGSASHMAGELFKLMVGVDLINVHYRGNGPALTDLLGGQVQVMFPTTPGTTDFNRAGKLRALGVTSAKRLDVLPDVPAIGEFVPGYEASQWYGIGAPRSTPPEIVTAINKQINAALNDSKMRGHLAEFDGSPMPMEPAQFASLIVAETEKWGKVVKFGNIKPE